MGGKFDPNYATDGNDLREDPRPPPEPLELVCEPCADYAPWQDDVPEIEVG